eukprot:282104_1
MEPETIETPTETRDLEAPFETASIVATDRGRESDNQLRVRIRSNSEFSEGDNTRNDGGINSVAFSKTLSNFYILHTLKSSDQTSDSGYNGENTRIEEIMLDPLIQIIANQASQKLEYS